MRRFRVLLAVMMAVGLGCAAAGMVAQQPVPPVPASAPAQAQAQTPGSATSSTEGSATSSAEDGAQSTTGESPEVAQAEAAIVKEDWKTAAATLEPWLQAHPKDGRALFDAGYVADQQNRNEAAEGFYRRAEKANPNSFQTHLMLGMLLARESKLNQARPELLEATTLDAGSGGDALKARAWRALARMDAPGPENAGNAAEASRDLLQALKLSPETEEDTLLAAQIAESAGQTQAAEAAYRRLLVKNPKSEAGNAGLAHLLLKQKKYGEAETLLRTALAADPENPALSAQLALALANQGKPEAVPLLKKLHAAHPENRAIAQMLADLLAQTGDAAGADALDVELLKNDPANPDLLVTHGQNLIQQMKYGEAYAAFEKATQADPGNGDAWSGLAFAAMRLGRPQVTLHALTERSKLLPEGAGTYFLWAQAYDMLHQARQAAVYYRHFLDAAGGRFPDQEGQARQRLALLQKK
ncbi:MAG TPA: tetratricopeptide repeat protein [Terracidiphilus sp.]|nr:tetratricopeptide repeat protein [Terracidiphilus sp.]